MYIMEITVDLFHVSVGIIGQLCQDSPWHWRQSESLSSILIADEEKEIRFSLMNKILYCSFIHHCPNPVYF